MNYKFDCFKSKSFKITKILKFEIWKGLFLIFMVYELVLSFVSKLNLEDK